MKSKETINIDMHSLQLYMLNEILNNKKKIIFRHDNDRQQTASVNYKKIADLNLEILSDAQT